MYCGYQKVDSPELNKKFADFWGVEALPAKPGFKIGDMVNGLPEGKLKAFWIFGENLVATEPDPRHVSALPELRGSSLWCRTSSKTRTTPFADVHPSLGRMVRGTKALSPIPSGE